MARVWSILGLTVVLGASTLGCCHKCNSCGGQRHGYWRNWSAGKHAVGTACCRRCELCDDVGGPCGGWSRTAFLESQPPAHGGESLLPPETLPTAAYETTQTEYRSLPPIDSSSRRPADGPISHRTLPRPY